MIGLHAAVLLASLAGPLSVTVLASDGSPVPGATLTLTVAGREETRVSGADGTAVFAGVRPGIDRLRAELPGFRSQDLIPKGREIVVELEFDSSVELVHLDCFPYEGPLRFEPEGKGNGLWLGPRELRNLPGI